MKYARYVFVLVLAAANLASAAMTVVGLKCEQGVGPLGIDVGQPRLFWQVRDDGRGARQSAWQVMVASTPQLLAGERGDLWDSGKVMGGQTTFVTYRGARLQSSQQVYWKVRSWDAADRPTPWSHVSQWTMGVMRREDWRAKWISSPERVENLLVRTEFEVKPGLVRALAHVSGLGQYELFLNSAKHGDDVLAPGWTDYRDTIPYDTRDVTALLHTGRNGIGLSLGNGMYHVVRPPGRFAKFLGSHGRQRAILQLRLQYEDGSEALVVTDDSWKVHAGPVTFSGIYGGEDFDARLFPEGWNRAGFDASQWQKAVVVEDDLGKLRGYSRAAEPVVPIEERRPQGMRELGEGVRLYDFGQNTSFIPRIRVSGPAGSRIRLTGGEVVNDDGTINRSTMGGAHRGSAWWEYTKRGETEEAWFPQFYYLGSRYLYVEAFPPEAGGERPVLEDVAMVVVHSAAAPVGEFRASDPRLNRIRDLVRWAQRSNMVSILTDCPHREKLGWLEQVHLNGPALRYEWDVARLMAKMERDMADAQTADGLVPNIAPEYTVFKGTFRAAAEWGASFIMVPWQQYLFTGETGLLAEHYPAMKRYFAYLDGRAAGGLLNEGLGDWYDQVLGKPGRANLTPGSITGTAHFFQNAEILAQMAGILGEHDDARFFKARAAEIRALYNRELFKPDTAAVYGSGSQTSLALPLAMGIVEPAERGGVLAALLGDISTRGHTTSGAVGYGYLLRALTDAGHSELIHRLITNEEIPGYSYQLKQGATSLAESWTAQRGASQNHFFLGQIVEWFYGDLAGLRPDPEQPGFKRMIVRPHLIEGLEWVEASHESLHGRHAVRWERRGDRLHLKILVPTNTTAVVHVPTTGGETVTEGGKPIADRTDVRFVRKENGYSIYETASGAYDFVVAR